MESLHSRAKLGERVLKVEGRMWIQPVSRKYSRWQLRGDKKAMGLGVCPHRLGFQPESTCPHRI